MLLLILFFIISLLPSIFLYIWMKKRKKDDIEYQNICKIALKKGLFISTTTALGFSACFSIIQIILELVDVNEIPLEIYYNFVLLAFSEELAKFITFKNIVKKNTYNYSLLDILCLMVIVALGFELLEACVYAIGADIGTMLTRGLTIMHGSYAFVMGYFYCKSIKSKNRGTFIFGFSLSVILHGLYDFCLNDVANKINENLVYVSLILAVVSIILIIMMIVYINKQKKDPKYNETLLITESSL